MRTSTSGVVLLVVVLAAAGAGLCFAAISTYDFVVHLDRQVHGVHCSYLLGLGATDASGSTGCYATLMSPYSSLWRRALWGGIPVALPAMSVFAFIASWALWVWLTGRRRDRRATGLLWAATALPVLSSAVMGYLSFVALGAACKLCIGIYVASALACAAAGVAHIAARKQRRGDGAEGGEGAEDGAQRLSWRALAAAFGVGVLFVVLPCLTYAAVTPDFSHYVGNCGSLRDARHGPGVLVPVGPPGGKSEVEVLEVLDPLCGACQVLERRFAAMSESRAVRRKLLLFPLDSACNWMVDEAIHPGACAASEAIFCADGGRADEVLGWIFERREELLRSARGDPEAPRRLLTRRFPFLRGCIGQPAVRARLNKALRWAVKNRLRVLTPQVYVSGQRLCDEDTDLGLEYALTRLIARARAAPGERPGRDQAEPAEPATTPPEPRRRRPRRRAPAPPPAVDGPSRKAAPAAAVDAGPAAPSAPSDGPTRPPAPAPTPAPAPVPPPASAPAPKATPPAEAP